MTTDEFKNLPPETRVFAEYLMSVTRDLRRIADALEKLVEQNSS